MIIIKINTKKLRKAVERILAITFLITFFLLVGFTGSYENDNITTGQLFLYVIPTLAVMGLAALGLNRLEEGGQA